MNTKREILKEPLDAVKDFNYLYCYVTSKGELQRRTRFPQIKDFSTGMFVTQSYHTYYEDMESSAQSTFITLLFVILELGRKHTPKLHYVEKSSQDILQNLFFRVPRVSKP